VSTRVRRSVPAQGQTSHAQQIFVTAAVIVALGTALISPSVGQERTGRPYHHVDFQKAIAHAVEQSASTRQVDGVQSNRANQPAMQRGYGGGGGHMMMVVSLVGMVAGIGMTYYMIKQMQKATGEATQTALGAEK
jgi:uncharacterized protein HemX